MPDMKTLKIGNKTYDIRDSRIGNLSNLNTTDKDSVVDAINETLTRTGPTDQQVQAAVDDYLDNHPTISGTFTNEAKNALLSLLEKVAYIDGNGQTYLDALEAELFPRALSSISAVFTQSSAVIYDTDSLDTLRQYLVVTANYSDGTSEAVSTYTLSGTLTVGTSTITALYGGKSDTFTVTVTGSSVPSGYEQVDYIFCPALSNAVGTYLDTGVKLSGTGTTEIAISFMDYGIVNAYPIGCLSSTTANTIGLGVGIREDSNADVICFSGGTPASIKPNPLKGVKHDVVATVNSSGVSITDGSLSNSQSLTPRTYNVANLYLFGMKKATANEVYMPFQGRIYSCKVTENNVDLLDLTPCVRLSDGMAGFWDSVGSTFLYDSTLVAAPSAHNTTAEIAVPGYYTDWANNAPLETASYVCGITKKYALTETTSLYPAGILPTKMNTAAAPDVHGLYTANVVIYDSSNNVVNHVNERASSARWAQAYNGTLTEYSHEWTVSAYSQITFDVDLRWIHSSYMYHVPTGEIFFAGRDTPYYGMHNISEAST